MKSLLSLVLGIVFCLAFPCEAKAQMERDDLLKKTYVDPLAIKVTKEGIFLLMDGNLLPVEAVLKDKNGVFVVFEKRFYVKRDVCHKKCDGCHKKYDADTNRHCPYCGH